MTTHLGEWIEECEKLDITITGKQAQEAIAKYKGVSIQQQTEARMPFSKNNFLDAIANFIVVTNQVFLFIYSFSKFLASNLFL
jgi:large-conductance mechanosensitive channel